MADLDQSSVPQVISRDLSETEKAKRMLQKRYKGATKTLQGSV